LLFAGGIALQREGIGETLAAVFRLLYLREDIADVPDCVAQRVIPLRGAVTCAPIFQRLTVSGKKALGFLAAYAVIPPGTAEDIVLLGETFEVGENFKTRL
jgi:hypothetical protein